MKLRTHPRAQRKTSRGRKRTPTEGRPRRASAHQQQIRERTTRTWPRETETGKNTAKDIFPQLKKHTQILK